MKPHILLALAAGAMPVAALAAAPTSLAPDWYFGGKDAGTFLAGVDPTADGHLAQFLLSKTDDPDASASLSQSMPAQRYLGQRVRFRARLRTRDLSNWGGLWMRIDGKDGHSLALYDSQDRPTKGTTGWQVRSVVLDVPPDAGRIVFGVLGVGTGQIWMEPLDLGTVGPEVPVDVLMPSIFADVTGAMPPALAREVVRKTIELVERRGLYPRRQDEYAKAKAELLAALDGKTGAIDRGNLYTRIQQLLWTLDADGHSFLTPARPPLLAAQPATPQAHGAAPDEQRTSAFALVGTAHGTVLRWVPAPITEGTEPAFAAWLKRFHDEAAQRSDLGQACALVVDLSAQTGGSAWPQMVAMEPLFGRANKANWVTRDGRRRAVVDLAQLDGMRRRFAAGRVNPLRRFADGPLAVLVGDQTASAGEMLLVALLGEDRVQTFGRTSYGMSTGNVTYTLADGSTLVLTETRYALGKGPVFHKGIAPMHPAAKGESWDASVKTAAEWAAANSPQCKARPSAAAKTAKAD
jgi:hypothetical protein